MARSLKDAFYSANYRVGQGIYTRAVSQGDNSLTESNFVNYDTLDSLADDAAAMPEFAGSQVCMDDVVQSSSGMSTVSASQTAMDAVSASQTAMDAVAASQTAMDAVSASQTARDVIGFSGLAYDTIASSNMAIGKYAIGYTNLSPADYADMDAVSASQTAMDAVSASQTAMDAVSASLLARNAFMGSSHMVSSVYSSVSGSENFWQEVMNPDGDIPFTYTSSSGNGSADVSFTSDTNNGSGSAIEINSNADASGGAELIFSQTFDFTNVNEIRLQYKDDGTAGGIVVHVDGTEEIRGFNSNSYSQYTVDTSTYSGELTLEVGAYINDGRITFIDELEFVVS